MHESECHNRLPLKRLASEVQRHQSLVKTLGSEFESLPPSQANSLPLRVFEERQSRVGAAVLMNLPSSQPIRMEGALVPGEQGSSNQIGDTRQHQAS